MVAEYFIVHHWRPALDATRATRRLSEREPDWMPVTVVIWAAAAVIGWWTEQDQIGILALNSLLVAGITYLVAGKVGLVRQTRERAVSLVGEED